MLSARVAERESGKIAGAGVREKSTVTVQSASGSETNMGGNIAVGSPPSLPPDTRRHRQIHEFTVPNVHGCVAIAWFRRASCSKRGGRWEMTSVLCLYYRLVQQDHALKPEPPGKFR